MVDRTINLHVRLLADFDSEVLTWLDEQVDGANEIFATADVAFRALDPQSMSFGGGIVHMEDCATGMQPTEEQIGLFASMNNVPAGDIVVFVAYGFTPWQGGGCGWHPLGQPGCMVTAGKPNFPKYKLAHELGHVLGLPHVDRSTRLMYPSVGWERLPPLLNAAEIAAIRQNQPLNIASSEPSLGIIEEDVRFELQRIEPQFINFAQYGASIVPLLEQICQGTPDEESRCRAIYALSLLTDDLPQLVAGAVDSPAPGVRRTAAAAVANCLPQQEAETLLLRLVKDPDLSVRHVAAFHVPIPSRGLPMVDITIKDRTKKKAAAPDLIKKGEVEILPMIVTVSPKDHCVFHYYVGDTGARVRVYLTPSNSTDPFIDIDGTGAISASLPKMRAGRRYLLHWSFQGARLQWQTRAELLVNGKCFFRHCKSSGGRDPVNKGFLLLEVITKGKKKKVKKNRRS